MTALMCEVISKTKDKKTTTHLVSTGVKHASNSFAHFKDELTCSLRFVRVLVQIGEDVAQQGINVWNLFGGSKKKKTHCREKEGKTKPRCCSAFMRTTHLPHQKREAFCSKLANVLFLVLQQRAVQTGEGARREFSHHSKRQICMWTAVLFNT